MPAANERALDKAKGIPADALIFDLEDAVAPDAKPDARRNAVAAALSGEYGNKEITIRCNGLDTQWGAEDLAAAAMANVSAVVIPKINSVKEVEAVSSALATAGAPLTPHLATALLAAREAGKVILDGVFNDVKDLDAFRDECVQGAQMGFDGKTLIHPSQVEIANEVWAPSADEVDYAQRVIAAFEEATAEGRGVITVDGRMIENLHVDNARRVLAVQAAIESLS
jgi:citrate lyase subunit beta/citryl-CoA lyase